MIEKTLKVDPPKPPPPARSGLLGAALLLVSGVVLLIGVSTLGALVGEAPAASSRLLTWQLVSSLGGLLLLPLLLACWLRRRGGRKRRRPSGATMVLLLGLLVLGALVATVPLRVRAALERRGHWWVEAIVRACGVRGDSMLIDAGRLLAQRLARWVPAPPMPIAKPSNGRGTVAARPAAPRARAPRDAGAPPRDRGADRGALVANSGRGQEVSFERGARGIVVPVRLRGPSGVVDVKMLFDTGASLSSIDSRTLSRLGINLTSSEPTITTLTANGRAQRTLLVLEGASIGKAHVGGGLSATLCDPCAQGDVVGLLGLNFSRHFTVTVDHEGGRLTLTPKREDPGSLYDIKGFVGLNDGRGVQTGDRFAVQVTVHNQSAYALRDLRLAAHFADGRQVLSKVLAAVAARSKQPLRFEGKLAGRAGSFTLRLTAGRWDLP